MLRKIILSTILCFSFLLKTSAQDDVNLFKFWSYYSDAENALYKHFCSIAFGHLDEREVAIGKLKTKQDWIERQTLVKKKLKEVIGPLPGKTPLNVQTTGVIHREGYRVEKLIYESQPGYYVTAALFIPEDLKGKAPAILNPIGHSTQSFRRDIYQHTIINLVLKGFMVLTYDQVGQGERLQYFDKELGKSRFPSTQEHSYPGAQCFLAGYSPANHFIWDGIRGIDLLLERPDVDPERIGLTGLSGGGTSTAFIMSLDDRIHAAAPECYITNFKYLYKSIGPQDAEQNFIELISSGLDHPDFVELRAPKPTLILSTTQDFFSIQGAEDSYDEAKEAFRKMGVEDHLQFSTENSGHGFTTKNREAMYAFFQKHLQNPGDSKDHDVAVIPEEELRVTETGQLSTSIHTETLYSLNKKIAQDLLNDLDLSRSKDDHLDQVLHSAMKISGYSEPNEFGSAVFSGRNVGEHYAIEKYLIKGSGDYMLPLVLGIPNQNPRNKLVLLLHEKGKEVAMNQDSLAKALLSQGYAILMADLPDIGEMGPGYLSGDANIAGVSYNKWFAGLLTGNTIVGLRAEDINRLVHFGRTHFSELNALHAVSIGSIGSDLMHATAFGAGIDKVCFIQPFLSFSDIILTENYKPDFILSTVPGAIKAYDLPDLLAKVASRKVLIIAPLSADGTKASEKKAKGIMEFPSAIYKKLGLPGNFEINCNANSETTSNDVIKWLE